MSQRDIKHFKISLEQEKPSNILNWEMISALQHITNKSIRDFACKVTTLSKYWRNMNRFDWLIWLFFRVCVCAALAHLKAPVFQMNTVTSALISGVIILGVMSVCFFIFSLTILKGKSTPVSSLSGVRNPAFNWAPEHNSPQTLLQNRQCWARGKQ